MKNEPLFFQAARPFFLFFLLLTASCERHYLSVSQQWIDGKYLASSKVGTPDPRALHPPIGQMLVIDWFLPQSVMQRKPHVELELIFWDYTKQTVILPIESPLSWATYRCLDAEYEKTGGILTYQAAICTDDGEVFRRWKHQLFVNLIQLDKED